jgi:RNA polymerase sigma-70 factor (ECF subfamily)
MQLSEEERVIQQNLNNSDVSALEWLFLRYYNDLCRYVLVTVHDEKTAKTIVQDLFIYIWENRLTIHFHKSIEAYIYQACRFNTLNYLRNQHRHETKNAELGRKTSIETPGPDSGYELEELEHILDEAIELLPDRCRQIFILSRKRELSYAEIAKQLSLSVSTVDNQINIAIKKIKAFVRTRYPDIFIVYILFDRLSV